MGRPARTLLAALATVAVAGACAGGEREQLSHELADRLAAAGVAAEDVAVYPPEGSVPHWKVELRVTGSEADAWAACVAVERLAVYEREGPYLVRVSLASGRVVECGWGRATPSPEPTGTSPADASREPVPDATP